MCETCISPRQAQPARLLVLVSLSESPRACFAAKAPLAQGEQKPCRTALGIALAARVVAEPRSKRHTSRIRAGTHGSTHVVVLAAALVQATVAVLVLAQRHRRGTPRIVIQCTLPTKPPLSQHTCTVPQARRATELLVRRLGAFETLPT